MLKYEAELWDGTTFVAREGFATITDARRWAERTGRLADRCVIRRLSAYDQPVAEHRRDHNGNGYRWFKATPR